MVEFTFLMSTIQGNSNTCESSTDGPLRLGGYEKFQEYIEQLSKNIEEIKGGLMRG